MTSAISVSNLYLKKNNHDILKNINIDIAEEECIAITGHNGAGKTTLLKTINNLIPVKKGTIKIFNEPFNNKIKKDIGYIPQTNYFDTFLPISVKEAISIGIYAKNGIFKKLTKEDNDHIIEIAKKLKIENLLNKPIGQLSGGQTQKVSIARVIAQDAKIILMDEPLTNLDKSSQKDILNIIDTLHKERKLTMIIVTHNLEQTPDCCNKIITMDNGEIVSYKNSL
jgi:ABC-type Mn2+/Zn2+ transport system ATPase subunit